jgi:methionine-rich copper-binding protein CopC
VAFLGVPAGVLAHGALRRSVPASGARLDRAPRELRLTFTERVELAVARLELIGPEGDQRVALSPLRS